MVCKIGEYIPAKRSNTLLWCPSIVFEADKQTIKNLIKQGVRMSIKDNRISLYSTMAIVKTRGMRKNTHKKHNA